MQQVHMTAAKRKYLSVLYELDPAGRGVRSVELCKKLHVSRPSVHSMLDKLSMDGFVQKEYYGIVYLTELGLSEGSRLQQNNV